jgi:hypothetical protein
MRDSFEENGYLGATEWEEFDPISPMSLKYLDISKRVNAQAHDFASNLVVNTYNSQELFSVCLFLRILEASQAVVILSRMGLAQDAAAILRGGLINA